MYCEQQKYNFIEQTLNSDEEVAAAKTLFGLSEKYEQMHIKDISKWSWGGLVAWYKSLPFEAVAEDITNHIILRYIRYYDSKSVNDTTTEIDLLKSSDTNGWVFDPVSLELLLGRCLKPYPIKDQAARCVLWMSYSGVPNIDQCLTLQTNSIKHECIILDENKYYIYEQGMTALLKLKEAAKYNNSDVAFGSFVSRGSIKQTLKDIFTKNKIRYTDIRKSGVFYRTYLDELNGIEPNFRVQAEVDLVASGLSVTPQRRYSRVKSLSLEYPLWKNIFVNK